MSDPACSDPEDEPSAHIEPAEARLQVAGDPQPVDSMRDRQNVEIANLRQDVELKRRYAYGGLIGMGVQLLIADAVFACYGVGVHWQIPGSVMDVWLGATVVQLIGVVLLITRYLFPQQKP